MAQSLQFGRIRMSGGQTKEFNRYKVLQGLPDAGGSEGAHKRVLVVAAKLNENALPQEPGNDGLIDRERQRVSILDDELAKHCDFIAVQALDIVFSLSCGSPFGGSTARSARLRCQKSLTDIGGVIDDPHGTSATVLVLSSLVRLLTHRSAAAGATPDLPPTLKLHRAGRLLKRRVMQGIAQSPEPFARPCSDPRS